MCAINFILDFSQQISPQAICAMNRANAHRGPDATTDTHEAWPHAQLFFGHNRLKIIDLSEAASQPMRSVCGRYVLIYNGEIYNHLALRQRLHLFKIQWRGHSDTETLLQLLIAFGADILPSLNGMFAFVFVDLHAQKILCARDTFGQKPLFWAQTPQALIVSSTLQGVLASGAVKSEPNISQIPHYLRYKFAQTPATFYQNIEELLIGNYLLFQNKTLKINSFMPEKPQPLPQLQSYEIIARTQRLLADSLQRHLLADVPVGLMLSGGTDSTLLLALLAEMDYKNFPVYGVVPANPATNFGTDDYVFAPRAAVQFGAEWNPITLGAECLDSLDEVVESMGQPIADGAAISTYFLAKAVKPLKVLLSGAGADEIFGGYNRHQAYYQYLKYLKNFPWDFIKKINKPLPEGYEHPLRKKFRLINRFVEQTHQNPLYTFRNFTALSAFDASFFKIQSSETQLPDDTNFSTDNYLAFGLAYDQTHYLPADILAMTDQTAMRHSVEIRAPYLDAELVRYVQHIPAEKLFVGGGKWILKELLKERKGMAYAQRAKEGFGLPVGQWLREPEHKHLIDNILDKKNSLYEILVYEKVKALVEAHLTHKADYTQELVALLMLFRWWKW
ncbi:asparagine synthase (glutamine-hydrolysing) [Flexibacter flexilis DSM 6793]|uniref:asparagine synthase (glutamine-hydrolyzing) n=1 Tax=Flexibacter flexilis DSM 6793 TaxID=927664 RepID=A0A1I1H9B8_9BACT|nr:asparagine synthase (glutamine-hydrolyzing) [Flexibacter flexilis]SFC20441.1 asparagine synthase (glutamine-hydrolysing) [Flexibacter flexilis DSM 6793]